MSVTGHSLRIPTQPLPLELPLQSAALLILDMQNDFCHPDGFWGGCGRDLSSILAVIPRLARLLAWARQAGVDIVFTRQSHRSDLADLTTSQRSRYAAAGSPVGQMGGMGRFLIRGERGTDIIEELAPRSHELQLDKPAHSAFVHTHLEEYLYSKGLTHLLITGVTTEGCVLATFSHANDLGFFGVIVQDCCGTLNLQDQAAAIHILLGQKGLLGWVSDSHQLLSLSSGEPDSSRKQPWVE